MKTGWHALQLCSKPVPKLFVSPAAAQPSLPPFQNFHLPCKPSNNYRQRGMKYTYHIPFLPLLELFLFSRTTKFWHEQRQKS